MNGASSANGAIVMIRKSTTLPRAWSTEVLKKIVPASATVTNASAAPLVAVISMSVPSPVRSAPCAPVTRCTQAAVRRSPAACPAARPEGTARRPGRTASPVERIGHPHVPSILGLRHCDEPYRGCPSGPALAVRRPWSENWHS